MDERASNNHSYALDEIRTSDPYDPYDPSKWAEAIPGIPEKDISSRIPTRPMLFAPWIDEDHAGTIEILNIPCDHR